MSAARVQPLLKGRIAVPFMAGYDLLEVPICEPGRLSCLMAIKSCLASA